MARRARGMRGWVAVSLLGLAAVSGGGGEASSPPGAAAVGLLGSVDGSTARAGFVTSGERAVLFVCGEGDHLAADTRWFVEGTKHGDAWHFERDGVLAEILPRGAEPTGHLQPASGVTAPLRLRPVPRDGLAGLYEGAEPEGRVGVLIDEEGELVEGALVTAERVLQVTPVRPFVRASGVLRVRVPDLGREIDVRRVQL